MSDESLYRRFFGARRHFSEKEAEYFLNINFVDQVAVVVLAEENGKLLLSALDVMSSFSLGGPRWPSPSSTNTRDREQGLPLCAISQPSRVKQV